MLETKFKSKYLLVWSISGLVAGLFLSIYAANTQPEMSFQDIPAGSLGGALIYVIIGGIGLLPDAANHQWKFNEITHPAWFWWIYPVISLFIISIAFCIGFIVSIVTSSNKK